MRALALVVVCGCGRIAFDPLETTADGATPTGCWQQWHDHAIAFLAPREITELAMASTSDPSITFDGLSLYYTNPSTSDIYLATRSQPSGPWTPSGAPAGLDSTESENKVTITEDGTFAVFSSNRTTNADFELWSADVDHGVFSNLSKTPVAALDTNADEFDPHVLPNGLVLYYAPVTTGQKIHRAARGDRQSPFVEDRIMTELARPTTYSDPTLSPDETVIVYAGESNARLFYATRTTVADPFGTPIALPAPVNDGNGRKTDSELSSDGCELYYTNQIGQKLVYTAEVMRR